MAVVNPAGLICSYAYDTRDESDEALACPPLLALASTRKPAGSRELPPPPYPFASCLTRVQLDETAADGRACALDGRKMHQQDDPFC